MIDRGRYRNSVQLYAFFTCPYCGGINKARVDHEYERQGEFDCIYCIACGRNLELSLQGFEEVYFREAELLKSEKSKPKRRKHEPVHV